MPKNGFDPLTPDWESDAPDEGLDLFEYWDLFRSCRLQIFICTLAAALTTSLLTVFVVPRWYRAQAVLRPASQESGTQQAVSLNASGILSNLGSSVGSSINSALGVGGGADDAQEFLVILASYDFTINLINKYHLQSHILPPTILRRIEQWFGINPYSPWRQFVRIQSLLETNYDLTSGNLTLDFQDRDPEMAARILGYFIGELRELLRKQAVNISAVAVDSLNRQIQSTSDALLVQQLDQLVAQQIQAQLTAEMQSDFAFTVDDPPVTAEKPYSPWLFIDPLAAGVLTLVLCVVWVLFYERVYKPQRAAHERRAVLPSREAGPESKFEEPQTANATVQRVRHR